MGQTPPPTDTPDAMPAVGQTWKDRLLGPGALEGGPLQKVLAGDNAKRTAAAEMHWNTAKRAASIYSSGYDPDKRDANGNLMPLDDEGKAKYYHQWKTSMDLHDKIAGVSKEHKGALQKVRAVMEHLMTRNDKPPDGSGGGGGAAPAGGGAGGGGPTPPPAVGAAPQYGSTVGESGVIPTPMAGTNVGEAGVAPGQAPTPPPTGGDDAAFAEAQLPFKHTAVMRQQALDDYKNQEGYLYKLKIEEDKAKAAAKKATASGNPPRPLNKRPISVLDAKALRDNAGAEYLGPNLQPIDLDTIPESMSLDASWMASKDPDTGERVWNVVYAPMSPNQKIFDVDNVKKVANPADVSKAGAATVLGEKNVPVTTKTTDPVTNLTTTSVRTPKTGGAKPTQPPAGGVPTAAPTQSTPLPIAGKGKGEGRPSATETVLDEGGHIPSGWKGKLPDGTPASGSVIEAANQLIDDRDVDKMPTKVRELGAQLARKFGWWQGKLTPADVLRMNEAQKFLKDMKESDALKVLDQSSYQRWKTGFASQKPREGGPIAQVQNYFQSAAAKGQTDQQAEFNRRSTQLAGVVAGLSNLVRSGRATNATVESIRRELPNVFNAKNSTDAKARIDQLLQEVDLVYKQGWKGTGGLTPPPGGATSDIDKAIMDAVSKASKPN